MWEKRTTLNEIRQLSLSTLGAMCLLFALLDVTRNTIVTNPSSHSFHHAASNSNSRNLALFMVNFRNLTNASEILLQPDLGRPL